jgi:hypothetical protein
VEDDGGSVFAIEDTSDLGEAGADTIGTVP